MTIHDTDETLKAIQDIIIERFHDYDFETEVDYDDDDNEIIVCDSQSELAEKFVRQLADDTSGCYYNREVWMCPQLIIDIAMRCYERGIEDA